jgi:uncharacterized protein YbaP (TraB family)
MTARRLQRRLAPILSILFLLVTTALYAQAPASQAAKPQRFFWKVTSPTTEVYLLGSIHVANTDMYPLPPEIEAAFQASKNLVVETDITKVNDMALALQVMQLGMYPSGDSLDQHISPESMQALRTFATANHLPIDALVTMKPALAAMTAEALLLANAGLDMQLGIDRHFLEQAHQANSKNIVELESADFQFKLIFGLDDKLSEKWLLDSLKDDTKAALDKTIKQWKEGDDKALAQEAFGEDKTDPDAAKMNDLIIYQRNTTMTAKIEPLLKGRDKSFVVVGAAHLIGEKGILKQLEAQGYKLERPTLTAPTPAASTKPGRQ